MNQKWELFITELKELVFEDRERIKEEKTKSDREIVNDFLEDKLNKDLHVKSEEYNSIYKFISKKKIKISGESVKTCLERLGYKCEYHKESLFISE